MNDQKITIKYIIIGILVVLFTWVLHEFAHWLTYTSFGYDYMMTLNKVSYLKGNKPSNSHQIIAGAAGPIITIIQALLAFLFLKFKNWKKNIYLFLFTAFYMRFLAGILNFINPNDEGAISIHFGIGLYTISIIVSGLLFYMVYKTSRKHKLKWKFQFWTTIIVMFVSSIIILSDQFIGIRII